MNRILKLAIMTIVLFYGFQFFKNGLTQSILSGAISKGVHSPVHIGGVNLQLISTTIDLKNIQILNPSSFPEKLMLDAPEIYISFDFPGVFKGLAHFKEVKLNLKEIVVVKNSKGELNINALKPAKKDKETQVGKAPTLQIDKLSLTIGRVVYKDYSQGGDPKIQVFDINIQNRQYTNIQNVPAVVSLIMFEALTRTSLSRLTDLDLDVFRDGAGSIMSSGLDLAGGVAGSAENTAKGLINLFK
ncbi:MAG: hypothetical protein AUJ72_04035 [Candidatus Omnitrophica bacterium CG1_02_46_14]|nr:MAG: hypothetical protein AUJ72_04035 [Candidatus Omnitrophica bacterium CG1_02_46_14]